MPEEKKELNQEILDQICGGSNPPSEAVAYLIVLLALEIEYKYKLWRDSNPNATPEQKRQQVEKIAQELYNGLDPVAKQALDEYFAENPLDWDKMTNNIVDRYN